MESKRVPLRDYEDKIYQALVFLAQGYELEGNFQAAEDCWLLIANNGSGTTRVDAFSSLCDLYERQGEPDKYYQIVMEAWDETDDLDFAYRLGVCFEYGRGEVVCREEAAIWYEKFLRRNAESDHPIHPDDIRVRRASSFRAEFAEGGPVITIFP